MKTYAVRLSPISSFQAFPASDTLFGAICWGIKRLYGDEKLLEMLKDFNSGNPRFVLSSAFPLLKNGKDTPLAFYPKPINGGLKVKDIEEIAGSPQENNNIGVST